VVNLTDADLSRLFSLQYVHGGEMRHVAHGVGASFNTLEQAGLVRIDSEELVDGSVLATHATITEKGRAVVDAMLRAGRGAIG
jgi:hypothetical protein